MLDDVDIFAPFRGDNNESDTSAEVQPNIRHGRSGNMMTVCIDLQTVLGVSCEIRFPCKASMDNPRLPDTDDFERNFFAFVEGFNEDREAIKMYFKAKGKVPLRDILDAVGNIHRILSTMEPSHFLSLLRKGDNK